MSDKNDFGTLKLSVTDTLDVMPDKLDLSMTFSVEDTGYDSTLKEGIKKFSSIIKILKEAGLKDDNIEAGLANVIPSYSYTNITKESNPFLDMDSNPFSKESYPFSTKKKSNLFSREQITEHTSVKTLTSYTYKNTITATFDVEDSTVAKVYCKLMLGVTGVTVTKCYRISDLRPHQDLLLANLVKKAKADADILASSSGYVVDGLVKIDKSVQNVSVSYSSSSFDDYCEFKCDDGGDFGSILEDSSKTMFNKDTITPKTISDSITVEYRLRESRGIN